MVFRRQHLLILGTEVLGEAHKAEIQAVGHRGSWEAERIMGGRKKNTYYAILYSPSPLVPYEPLFMLYQLLKVGYGSCYVMNICVLPTFKFIC